jgi:LysM repeat protein
MDVNIPARISFASGATSATVNGTLPSNGNQYYILKAQKNQNMQVQVTPQQGIKLTVYGVDGTVLQSGMSGAASFSGSLPSTQDYILVLSSTNNSGTAISYSLQVSITSPQGVIPNTGQTVYIVQQGDTLSRIAQRFGTTTSALMQANPQITNPSLIFPGERIVIPGNNS